MAVNDIELPNGAVSFAHKRKYDNLKFGDTGLSGFGWQVNEMPTASRSEEGFHVDFTKDDSVRFALTPDTQGIYAARNHRPDTLKIDSVAKTFQVTRKNGTVWTFSNDPIGRVPQGLPVSVVADNGKSTEFAYQRDRLNKVVAKGQAGKILAELEYTYNSTGLLTAITLRESNGNVLKPVKRVLYSYYTDADSCGNAGDLKSVMTEMACNDSWKAMETYGYRYYKNGDPNGQQHAMKMAFFPADFEFAQQSGVECLQVSDAEALEFATKYYEYDGTKRSCTTITM